jgi:ABC-type bacteriocin/lantibiotic exporter with double-glycine peptidase domain
VRKTALSPLVLLLSRTRPRTRATLAVLAVIACASRLVLVLAALQVGRGELVMATSAAVVVGIATALNRMVQASARVQVECDLYRAAARAVVETDPVRAPTRDLQQSFFDGEHYGRDLLATTLPGLAADAAACAAVVPILATALPVRVLVIAGVSFAVVIATLMSLRGVTQRLQTRLLAASQRLFEVVLGAIEGRLELVARGGEAAFRRELDDTLDEYARVSRKVGVGAALLGRAPLVAGVATVALAVVVDGSSRHALAITVLGQALLLAACLPPLLGVVMGLQTAIRTGARLAPFLEILGAERRSEIDRGGLAPPSPPFDIAIDGVTYRYTAESDDVLSDLKARWPRGGVLLIAGPNGAGKSTLLRLLLSLGTPREGTIRFGKHEAGALDITQLRRTAAYLPQRPYLGHVYQSVRAAMHIARPDASDDLILRSLARVEVLDALAARADDPLSVAVGELSAGQRQRVGLARVLVQEAGIVVLDEPDANLDQGGISLVARLVRELSAAGTMVAVAAHTLELAQIAAVRIDLRADATTSSGSDQRGTAA